ncbi:MAG: hypothetical protein ABWX82_03065 [Leifsonia sp.]
MRRIAAMGLGLTLVGGLSLVAAAPAVAAPDLYSVSGVVTAQDANPDFAPSVRLTGIAGSSDIVVPVDPTGAFSFDNLEPGPDLSLVLSADGYGTEVRAVPVTDADVTVSVALLPVLTAGTVSIAGSPTVGSLLTATSSGWPTGTSLSYQWGYSAGYSGGPIDGATGTTYTVTPDMIGNTIVVIVTGSLTGFAPSDASEFMSTTVSAAIEPAAAAPVADSADLPAYLAAHGSTPQEQTATGLPAGALNPTTGYTANVGWTSPDSFVDVYVYSKPILVGSFPVVNGVVQVSLSAGILSQLAAGAHTLVVVGQSSGAVQSVSLSIAPTLASTGFDAAIPAGGAALLLLVGAALILVRRRSMQA